MTAHPLILYITHSLFLLYMVTMWPWLMCSFVCRSWQHLTPAFSLLDQRAHYRTQQLVRTNMYKDLEDYMTLTSFQFLSSQGVSRILPPCLNTLSIKLKFWSARSKKSDLQTFLKGCVLVEPIHVWRTVCLDDGHGSWWIRYRMQKLLTGHTKDRIILKFYLNQHFTMPKNILSS